MDPNGLNVFFAGIEGVSSRPIILAFVSPPCGETPTTLHAMDSRRKLDGW